MYKAKKILYDHELDWCNYMINLCPDHTPALELKNNLEKKHAKLAVNRAGEYGEKRTCAEFL